MRLTSVVFVLSLSGVPPAALVAQRAELGTVTGTVRAARGGSGDGAVQGVRVFVEGAAASTLTDALGRYRLADVPAGERVIAAQRVGFRVTRRQVTVPAADTVEVTFELTPAAVQLGAVVVTATREEAATAATPASIGVVDSAAIANTRPHHSAEITNRIPGVLVIDLGGEGHTMALRLPINYAPMYQYLQDGIPIRSTGFFNHNALYEINVPDADRIEVFKGPATALYGSDAIGGVVNVLTRAPSPTPAAELFLEGGRFGYGRILASASNTWGRNGLRADVNVTHFNGWRDAAHQDRQSATVRWDSRLDDRRRLKTLLAFSNIDSPGDGGSDVSEAELQSRSRVNYAPIAFRKVRALRWSTGYQALTERSLVDVTAYARYNSLGLLPNWQLTYDPQVWDTHNYSVGLLAKFRRSFAPWQTSVIVGADVDYSPGRRVEDSIIVTQAGNVFTSYTLGARQYDYRVTFRGVSPYVHAEATPLPRLHLSTGLRFDRVGYDYRNNLSVVNSGPHRRPASTAVWYSHLSPKLGMTYEFGEAVNAFVSYRHGFRVPSEDQLFAQGSAENTVVLQPVRSNSYEAGVRARPTPRLAIEASAYTMDVTDDILSFFNTLDSTSVTSNAGRTRHQGVEAGASLALTDRVRLDAAYAYTRHRYVRWVTETGVDYSGNAMEAAPRHIANSRVTFAPARGGAVAAEWVYVGGYFIDPENKSSYDGHHLLNVYFNAAVTSGLSVVGRLNNVTAARYATTASFNPFLPADERARFSPGMPRSFFVGVQYGWGR